MEKSLYAEEYRVLLAHLRDSRVQRGITQTQMAEQLGTTQSLVSKCERGERRLDAIELRRWVIELGLSFPEFIAEFETILMGRKARAMSASRRRKKAE
jgi:transcriptional regulator with XRE-family HTH domain